MSFTDAVPDDSLQACTIQEVGALRHGSINYGFVIHSPPFQLHLDDSLLVTNDNNGH
jgi:hypothetical protein